nr:retrovirus-related Pol polyprotein from transposon TNT 1-94 [Tanacetum cinerariifolium]
MLADSKLPTMFWTEAVSTACYVLNRVSITNPHNKTPYELLSGKGMGQEWYFDLDYLADSLGYTRFKTNTHAGTQDTNMNAGTQDDDSEFKCDEHAILVPSFPSTSFLGPKYGFEFSNETAEMLHQAKIETRRNLVLAAGDPASSIVSAGSIVPAGSVPAGSVLASHVPASSVPASHYQFCWFCYLAVSEFVPVVLPPDHAANSTLPPGLSLGSSEQSTRFPSPSDIGNHQPTAGIFFSSSYDDDFCTDVTNLASSVVVDLVATKRVNTIHP